MNIRIDRDKNGKKVAYEITRDYRNIRTSLEAAELMIANGTATSVTYGPNPSQPGVRYIGTEIINGTRISNTAFVL